MQTLNKAIIVVVAAAAASAAIWFVAVKRGSEAEVLVPLGPLRVDLPPVISADLTELVQTHDFRFRSTLREPLRVLSTTASCGCTIATSEPEVIEPGGELVVRTVTSLDRAASRQSTVWVRFEDGRGLKMSVSASLRRPVLLSTSPPHVHAEAEQEELAFKLVWTGSGNGGDVSDLPPPPEFRFDRGEVQTTFEGWSPATVDLGLFGAEGPPAGTKAYSGEVRLARRSPRWPAEVVIRTPGADPLELQLRDLVSGE